MTRQELKDALRIAQMGHVKLNDADDSILIGFALPDFKPATVSLLAVARMVRWQCLQLNGRIDNEALTEIATSMRHKVTVMYCMMSRIYLGMESA